MIALEVLYIALATILVMVLLQFITFIATKLIYPPEPKIIYQQVPVYQQSYAPPQVQAQAQAQPIIALPPTLTQPQQEVQLPEYEPRKPTSTSLRVDPELPNGLQETRPDGA